MSSATSTAASVQRNSAPAQRPVAQRPHAEQSRSLLMGKEEAAVLKIDLSDVQLPEVGGLQIDGFKPSFFERLFGKR